MWPVRLPGGPTVTREIIILSAESGQIGVDLRGIHRPLLGGCLVLIAVIALWQQLADPPPWESDLFRQFYGEEGLRGKQSSPEDLRGRPVTVTGLVYEKEVRTLYGEEVLVLYLKSVIVSSDTSSGDEVSVPNISGQKFNEKLVCQLTTGYTAREHASAGGKTEAERLWEQICLGSHVTVQGRMEFYQHATNPGEWDNANYNLINNVAGQLKEARLLGSDKRQWRIREALLRLRRVLKERLWRALPSREASVLAKMLLGEKYELDREIRELYQNNGIAHVLAISGLHITLLGMGLYGLLRRCGCPIVPSAIIGGCMILFYGGLVGWGISAVRAIGMYLIRMLGEIWGKRYDMLTAMGVLAAGMVCHNPRLVYHCGFLLSFGAVVGMGVIYPALLKLPVNSVLERMIRSAGRADKAHLKRGLKAGESKLYWKYKVLLWFGGLIRGLLASLAVTLATMPIQLWFFYQIPVYGILLNIVVLPLMGLLLTGGLILMFFPAAYPARWVVMGILGLYEELCRLAEGLPGHLWITGCPRPWQIAAYYGILTAVVCMTKRTGKRPGLEERNAARADAVCESVKRRMIHREFAGAGSIAAKAMGKWESGISLLLLTMAVILLTACGDRGFSITMLDVGQGDCVCVRTARGLVYLFDGGSSSRSGVGEYVLIPYLKYQGIRTIDGIFLSHGDQDHINAVRELLSDSKGIRLKVLYLPQSKEPLPESLEELRALAWKAGCKVEYLSQGKGWAQGDFRLTCLWPHSDYGGGGNAGSACYLLEEKDFRVLLTGDVEGEGERQLTAYLRTMSLSGLDVLKVAHHGSRYSTLDAFLQAVTPRLALISAGRDNSYGHPHEETLRRLENRGCRFLQTADGGAIIVRCIHNKMVVEKFR